MAEPSRLLAKSWQADRKAPPSVFLPGHLRDVYQCARQLLDVTADDQLGALGLSSSRWRRRLEQVVSLAAAVHDIGKANDHFQEMVRGTRLAPQGLRHEWVTYIIFQQPPWSEWLRVAFKEATDWHVMLWAVTGHHPGRNRPTPPLEIEGGGVDLRVFLGHTDLREATAWIAHIFGLPSPPDSPDLIVSLVETEPESAARLIRRRFRDTESVVWQSLGEEDRRFVAACKACLIAADVGGSALPRAATNPAEHTRWLRHALRVRPDVADLKSVVKERLRSAEPRAFQREISETNARITLVRAGCGSGKTIAAYLWAASRCPGRRLYFCYPTTGTATEGFRDYLFDEDAGSAKHGARLFHSRAADDLEMILHARDDGDEEPLRVESLQAWSTPVACCTVDTVVGLVQNQRRGLFTWPALSQAAFVFDEIHAYDDQLFGCLLRFLQAFCRVPILLMTASLPRSQHRALANCVDMLGERLSEISGPTELEELPRYRQLVNAEPARCIEEALSAGGKVLWVCNTVERAIRIADQFRSSSPFVYHSRFRYQDRVERHSRVIAGFADTTEGKALLAVCTQVAEMSLDISATLLVSDLAPVPSIIQRLGRLNRRATPPGSGHRASPPMPFVIVEPRGEKGEFQPLPYTAAALEVARNWLSTLGHEAVSQRDLARAWESLDSGEALALVPSTWIDGGPVTRVDSVRDASPGITVILEEDAKAVESGVLSVTRAALPMPPPPRDLPWQRWSRVKGMPVAPSGTIDYTAERGARWGSR